MEIGFSLHYIDHEYFSITGFREGPGRDDILMPTITCSGGSDVPPPSPPHPASCDLMPEYEAYPIGSRLSDGADATVKPEDQTRSACAAAAPPRTHIDIWARQMHGAASRASARPHGQQHQLSPAPRPPVCRSS